MEIAAGQFKAQCLQLMDQVKLTHEEIIITKHGRPVAKLVPVEDSSPVGFIGFMTGAVVVNGDLVAPIDEDWEVDSD